VFKAKPLPPSGNGGDGTNTYPLAPATVSASIAGIYFGSVPAGYGAATVPSDPGGIGIREFSSS
jgi:hypothetical protein